MIIEHFIAAKSSAVDESTNSLSVFEFIEDLTVQIASNAETPQTLFPMQIIAIFKRTDEVGMLTLNCRFALEDLDGSVLIDQVIPIVMQPNHVRYRARMNVPLLIKASGVYKFKVSVDDVPHLTRILESNITIAYK